NASDFFNEIAKVIKKHQSQEQG
ncbi:TPA: hypothetical protein ACYKHK_000643, partial [Campylobacter coli]